MRHAGEVAAPGRAPRQGKDVTRGHGHDRDGARARESVSADHLDSRACKAYRYEYVLTQDEEARMEEPPDPWARIVDWRAIDRPSLMRGRQNRTLIDR